jgi:hypothetical protein
MIDFGAEIIISIYILTYDQYALSQAKYTLAKLLEKY